MIDHATVVLVAVGAAWSLLHLRDPRHAVLWAMVGASVIAGGVLVMPPASSARLLGIVTPVAAFAGLGVDRLAAVLSVGHRQWRAAVALTGVGIVAAYSLAFYFVDYARGDYYSDTNTRISEAVAGYAHTLPPETPIFWYGAPYIFAGHPTLKFETRDRKVYDVMTDGTVVPPPDGQPGPAAFFALPPREGVIKVMEGLCAGGRSAMLPGPNGSVWAFVYVSPPGSDCARFAAIAAPTP